MYNFAADKFAKVCFLLHDLMGHALCLDTQDEQAKESLKAINDGLSAVESICKQMGYDCAGQVSRAKSKIMEHPDDRTAEALIEEIMHGLVGALKGRSCFIMTSEETRLYNREPLIPKACNAFPESEGELGHAGNCLALGEAHACIFHSMNALEGPLRAQARYFGVPFTDQTSWGAAIEGIKGKIEKIERTKKTNKRTANDALAFHGEAAKEFSYFKDAWRNHIMHQRGSYDLDSAKNVYIHVVTFIEHISRRFSIRTGKRYKW